MTPPPQETLVLIGGSGPQGRGLALRFALAGIKVYLGSRSAERGQETAANLNQILTQFERPFRALEGGENEILCHQASQLWLVLPFEQAAANLRKLTPKLDKNAVVVDVTVPLEFHPTGVRYAPPAQGSGSQYLRQRAMPNHLPLCGAAKTIPAHVLENIQMDLNCDSFVYGDNKEARLRVRSVLAKITGLRPLDAGGLAFAPVVEGMTALLIRLNRLHKSRSGCFYIQGLGK